MRYTDITDKHILYENRFYADTALIDPIVTQNYRIIQAADSHYLSDFRINEHRQVCDIELTYVHYGEMKVSVNGAAALCKRGDVSIAFKEDAHALWGDASCRFQTVAVDVREDSPMQKLLTRATDKYGSRECRSVSLSEIEDAVADFLLEFGDTEDELSVYSLDALITSMLMMLLRVNEEKAVSVIDESERLLPLITGYIDRHALDISNLDEVANYFGYSYNYLYKIFRAYYKRSPKEYLTERRMLHADGMLRDGASISEVAERLGYSTPYNFSRAYKEYFGASPKYRRGQ